MSSFPGSSIFDNATGKNTIHWVDMLAIRACKQIHYYNPTAIQCARLILSGIFKEAIKVERGGVEMEMKGDFKHVYENFFIPFGERALEELLCVGLVAVKFVWLDEVGYVPVVVEEEGKIGFILDRKKQRHDFYFFPKGYTGSNGGLVDASSSFAKRPDTSVMVLSGFSLSPDSVGNIRSPIAALLKDEMFMSTIDTYLLMSEESKAAPWILAQLEERATDGFGGNGEGNAGMPRFLNPEREAESRVYQKKLKMAAEIELMQFSAQLRQEVEPSVVNNAYYGNLNFQNSRRVPKVWPLDVGQVSPQAILPSSRTDWIEMHEYIDKRVLEAHGIPFAFKTGGGHLKAGVLTSELVYYQTLAHWRKKIALLFNEVFSVIYGDRIFDEAIAEATTAFDSQVASSTDFDPVAKETILRSDIKNRVLSKTVKFYFPNQDLKDTEKSMTLENFSKSGLEADAILEHSFTETAPKPKAKTPADKPAATTSSTSSSKEKTKSKEKKRKRTTEE